MNKVFGIGAHKTATSSLAMALNALGIKCSHWEHHEQIMEHISRGDYSLKVLEGYDAIADLPVPSIYKEMDARYPQSRFILTVREPESWFNSAKNHILDGGPRKLVPEKNCSTASPTLINQRSFADTMSTTKK